MSTEPTRYLAAAKDLLDRLESQGEAVGQVARLCADAIAADGLVHLFGTGHSRIPVEEMFPRYGSYPGFHPIVEPGPTGVTIPSSTTIASPGGVQRSSTTSA